MSRSQSASSGRRLPLSWWHEKSQDEIQFAFWVPNVSGGLVQSTTPMQTRWDPEALVRYARTAEENGFAMALLQARWFAGHAADHQHEAFTLSAHLLANTSRLEVIAACHTGLWHPAVVAKMLATLDVVSGGRASLNVLSGWSKEEFVRLGEPWLEHGERYRRSEEFITVLRNLWGEDEFSAAGWFYRIDRARLRPKPVHQPMVFQGGNSTDARAMAGRVSDVLLMNGDTNAGFSRIIYETRRAARSAGRGEDALRFGANAFCIVRKSEDEAVETHREIIRRADGEAVSDFARAVRQAGQSTADQEGMWTDSVFEDLVQYNDGFKTDLIGTANQVADRIIELKKLGVNIILCGFLHYEWELHEFGRDVIPLVREREVDLRRRRCSSIRLGST